MWQETTAEDTRPWGDTGRGEEHGKNKVILDDMRFTDLRNPSLKRMQLC